MSPFDPIGEKARWRCVYDLLVTVPTGGVVTYEQLGEVLDLHPMGDRHAIQMAVRRAAKQHEEDDKRAIDSVPNVGYRVVEVPEHLQLARRQQRRSHRALARGHSKVVHVDLSGLEPEAQKAFHVMAQAFALQMDFNRRFDVRQQRLENAVQGIAERHDRSEAELRELRERLARLEASNDKDT